MGLSHVMVWDAQAEGFHSLRRLFYHIIQGPVQQRDWIGLDRVGLFSSRVGSSPGVVKVGRFGDW